MDAITFQASLPPIGGAIKVSGDGDTLRLQLDVPLRSSPDAVKMMLLTGKRLIVTVVEDVEQKNTW